MAVSQALARKLCTAQEWSLVSASRGTALAALPPSRLKAKISRARTLRDKYRGLAQRQAGEARGKRGARSTRPAQSNQNTQRKAQLFGEALERFQARLAAVEHKAVAKDRTSKPLATARQKARKAAASTAKVPKRTGPREDALRAAGQASSRAARATRKASRIEVSGKAHIRGHVGARGRRRQGRRDSR